MPGVRVHNNSFYIHFHQPIIISFANHVIFMNYKFNLEFWPFKSILEQNKSFALSVLLCPLLFNEISLLLLSVMILFSLLWPGWKMQNPDSEF